MRKLLLFFFLFIALPASAQAGDMFTVRDIAVRAAGTSATDARGKAIMDAEVLAFENLVQRITPLSQRATLPKFSYEKVHPLVQSFEIQQERIARKDYTATVAVLFNANAVTTLLNNLNISYRTEPGPRAVVLPLLNTQNRLILWESGNPWRTAWDRLAAETGIVQLAVPLGDLDDITKASPQQVLSADFGMLLPLAKKYDADLVFIPFAQYQNDPLNGAPILAITVRMLSASGLQEHRLQLPVKATEHEEALLNNAALEALAHLEQASRAAPNSQSSLTQKRLVTVPISSLQEWVEIQQQLNQTHFLENLRLVSLAPAAVEVEMTFIGDLAVLKERFAKEGFTLEEQDGRVILRRGGE